MSASCTDSRYIDDIPSLCILVQKHGGGIVHFGELLHVLRFSLDDPTLHDRRAHSLDKLMPDVSLQRGTVLAYLLQLVSERPYGETTRLVARLLPSELLRQLLRVEPSVLYGRLRPLVHTLDSSMGRQGGLVGARGGPWF